MWELVRPQNRMRETLRAHRHEVDEKPLQRIEKGDAHIPSFACRLLSKHVHMSHLASLVIHPEHAEYVLGCSGGGTRADRRPNGTYITDMNKGHKLKWHELLTSRRLS
jgi:hypothetical protein